MEAFSNHTVKIAIRIIIIVIFLGIFCFRNILLFIFKKFIFDTSTFINNLKLEKHILNQKINTLQDSIGNSLFLKYFLFRNT